MPLLVRHDVRFIVIGGGAGRPKDLEVIAELQALLEEHRKKETSS